MNDDDTLIQVLAGYTLPFGKWKGHTLACVGMEDGNYLEWLARQDWVRVKFPEIPGFVYALLPETENADSA